LVKRAQLVWFIEEGLLKDLEGDAIALALGPHFGSYSMYKNKKSLKNGWTRLLSLDLRYTSSSWFPNARSQGKGLVLFLVVWYLYILEKDEFLLLVGRSKTLSGKQCVVLEVRHSLLL